MSYIVKSKVIEIDKKIKKENKKSVGDFYSNDRFYTLINEYVDKNLDRKSKVLGFIVKYLFKSSNYKHDPSIANGRSIWIVLLDVFCVLCLIGFFAMVFAVVGTSIANIPVGISGLAAFGKGFIESISSNITMLIFAIIFLVIGISWLVMFFKIRKKNAVLSLQDYVTKKISFILKFRWLIKAYAGTKEKAKGTMKMAKKEVQVFCLNKFEQQGGSAPRWLNIQLINLLASIFVDFNIVFKFDTLTDEEYAELDEIIKYDFNRIELLKI